MTAPRDSNGTPDGSQRIRIGLMGLAVVFLLVMAAAAFFGLASRDAGTTRHSDALTNAAAPAEPLAELGVAPGGSTEPVTDNRTAPPR